MKGKLSTKAIVIAILTVVLLGAAATGTVLFLKDNGEAAATEEPKRDEVALPITGDSQTSTTVDENGNSVENTEAEPGSQLPAQPGD